MKPAPVLLESPSESRSKTVAAPVFLVDLEPWHTVFFRNLADVFRPRRRTPYLVSSPPGSFWPDVFVSSRLPWNRFAQQGQLMRAHARPELAAPDLLELLSLDEAGFRRRFAGTPMLRAKRRGLLRNVCVALGNTGAAAALPALEKAAADPEPLISEHALWAITQIKGRLRSSEEAAADSRRI